MIKEKSGMIVKLIIFQIAMSIFGVMIASSVIILSEGLLLLAGIFSVLFYFALVGAALNEDGLKDNIRASRESVAVSAFTGFKYALISYVPTLLITLVLAVLRTVGVRNSLISILVVVIRAFLSGMYLGLDTSIFGAGETVMTFSANGYSFLIYQMISILACGVFYYIGFRGINLLPKKKEEN